MSKRIEIIAMLTERIEKVNEDTREDSTEALLALATAALALETLCQAEVADKKARDEYNQRKLSNIGSGPPGK